MSLKKTFTKQHIEHFKNNKHLITSELLEALRSKGNEGKLIALEILDTAVDDEKYHLDSFGNRISFNGNRALKGNYVKMDLAPIHLEELEKCYNDMHFFIANYVQIVTNKGVTFPDPRPYQNLILSYISKLDDESQLILSSRQSAKSTTIGMYLTHSALFMKDINIGICANKAGMAREFLDKIRKMYTTLPMWMKVGTVSWNKSYVEFDNGVRIMTDATSENSFRGYTCLHESTLVNVKDSDNTIHTISLSELNNKLKYSDYLIQTPWGYGHFDGLKKTTSKGKKIILEDDTAIRCTDNHMMCVGKTSKGKVFRKAKNLKVNDKIKNAKIKSIIDEAEGIYYDPINVEKGNTYIVDGIEHHNCHILVVDEAAFIRPTVYSEFEQSIYPSQGALTFKKKIITSTANGQNHFYHLVKGAREKTNGFSILEVDWREVPRFNSDGTIKDPEVFKDEIVSQYGTVYFESNYGNDFIGSSHTFIRSETLNTLKYAKPLYKKDGILNIYEEPVKGHQYVMGVDPSMGINGDFFGVQVVDITNLDMKQVASARLNIEYLKMPEYIYQWAVFFNNAYLIIENNLGSGQSIADMIVNNFEYENIHYDKSSENNKRKKYPGFRTTTKTRKQILDNMKLFIENRKLLINDEDTYKEFFTFIYTKGKFQADDGCKDDMIMALALCFAPFCNTKNFEDMRQISKVIFGESSGEEIDVVSLLSFGFFDDGTETERKDEWGYTMDYYGNQFDSF